MPIQPNGESVMDIEISFLIPEKMYEEFKKLFSISSINTFAKKAFIARLAKNMKEKV